ncbi:hypothetical protein EVAR_51544_1 [Eumeta japonica]|uniref:Gustatory receptor n=1 Tax=Eumeta variegata TaxID=151549 RepID=A0A4C1YH34_EUMVA|nr:hypothetical protein EVAR_51544_1 [Eumeta japonica]
MPDSNEYLLNNAVGEDLQRALRPFDLVRELLFVSKYRIKDNFITPRSRKYYTFSLMILLIFLYAYKDIRHCLSQKCVMITYVMYPVAYATVIAAAAYHSTSAVEIVTRMQGINRKLRVIDSTRRLAKNVLRLCGARYRKMRACGLFAVDAALPLRLLALITTYCIVLLQFAFL